MNDLALSTIRCFPLVVLFCSIHVYSGYCSSSNVNIHIWSIKDRRSSSVATSPGSLRSENFGGTKSADVVHVYVSCVEKRKRYRLLILSSAVHGLASRLARRQSLAPPCCRLCYMCCTERCQEGAALLDELCADTDVKPLSLKSDDTFMSSNMKACRWRRWRLRGEALPVVSRLLLL